MCPRITRLYVCFMLFSTLLLISCQDRALTPNQEPKEESLNISYSDAEVDQLTEKVKAVLKKKIQTPVASQTGFANSSLQKTNETGYLRIDEAIRGVEYSMIRPENWNGDLVLLVHGSIPEVSEFLANALANMGFGVAGVGIGSTTVKRGINEASALKDVTVVTRLIQEKFSVLGKPERTYLLSFSRGAHNATRLLEKSSPQYDGYLSVCGGNGGAQMAWDHFFTSRILFDHFFPGVLPGTPLEVPRITEEQFANNIIPQIVRAVTGNPAKALEMGNVDQYHVNFSSFDELVVSIVASLQTHTIGVNDLIETAGGNPFDNTNTKYTGSPDDAALNTAIERLKADRRAREFLKSWYEPSGKTGGTPLIILHTSRDPSVPEKLHNDKYESLLIKNGNGASYVRKIVDRFGHCAFSANEIFSNLNDLRVWAETGVNSFE